MKIEKVGEFAVIKLKQNVVIGRVDRQPLLANYRITVGIVMNWICSPVCRNYR